MHVLLWLSALSLGASVYGIATLSRGGWSMFCLGMVLSQLLLLVRIFHSERRKA